MSTSNAVIIDGYTQPGSKKNTRLTGAINAVPKVQLDGSGAGLDADGLIIQGMSDNTIRGLIINRFDRSGIFLTSTDNSDNNHFEGNFIGTNATGTAALGNGSAGVEINSLNDGNVVGGDLPEQRNLISGNQGDGIFAGTDGTDTIQRNLVGTDKSGTKDLHNGTDNNGEGVNLGGQNSVVSGNIIAFNTWDGVQVRSNSTGVGHDIGPNSIFSNDGLGIDIVNNANNGLGPSGDGPNANDGGTADDADTGPNDLQNFPAITFATNFHKHRRNQDRRVPGHRRQHAIPDPVLLQPARHRRGEDLPGRHHRDHKHQRDRLGQRLLGEHDGSGGTVDNRDRHQGHRASKHVGVQRGTPLGQGGPLGHSDAGRYPQEPFQAGGGVYRTADPAPCQSPIGTASNPFSVLRTLTRKSPGSW